MFTILLTPNVYYYMYINYNSNIIKNTITSTILRGLTQKLTISSIGSYWILLRVQFVIDTSLWYELVKKNHNIMNTQVKVLTQVRVVAYLSLARYTFPRQRCNIYFVAWSLHTCKTFSCRQNSKFLMDFAEISLLMLISNNQSFIVKYLPALLRVSFVKNIQHIYLSNSQHFIIQCF